ncbi:MAG TPA: cytochrome P450 [Cyanobacteria bacterium UBA8553]|nr:cytochrome P450 [Cyanobacteria bacterium UBA8553]HAJ64242.1 cytochrome P450 [Cyanobacteria bacterium UBA8543]
MSSTASLSPSVRLTVPGPSPSPFFGSVPHALRFGADSVGYTRQLFQTYGPVVSLSAGGGTNLYSSQSKCPGTVFAYGPEVIRTVASQHDTYYKYPLTGPAYRKRTLSARHQPLTHFMVGLFGLNGDPHRQFRQLLMPNFHKQRIESYRNDIVAIAQSILDQMPVTEECDILEVMRRLTIRVTTKILFGFDMDESGTRLGKLLEHIFAQSTSRMFSFLPFDLPGLPYHRYLNLMAQFEDEMRALVARKQEQSTDDTDVLSMLIAARDATSGVQLSEDEVLGHVGVFFGAGYDTTAVSLSWTLFLLSQHPDIFANLLDELESVLQGEAPTVGQLHQLPLLDRVIKESMRILPAVPWNGRVTSKPTELGGYALPEGTEVFVSIYQTHHMPELYAEPEVFNPQRWETIEPSMFEYVPFSAGSRTCIGAAFALIEMKIVLAMLLQRYRLEFVPKVDVDRVGVIVMEPKYGLPMTVHQQDRQFTQGVRSVRGNVREMVNLPE